MSAIPTATPNASERRLSVAPDTRRITGLAVATRSTNSPIDAITERKTTQRAVRSDGVAAVSEIDGMTNWGAGPGFGPTAKVKAPRTGCPSTEITRQKTRYQPWAR